MWAKPSSLDSLLVKVRAHGKVTRAVASSGFAATFGFCGRTTRSRFKITIQATKNTLYSLYKILDTPNLLRLTTCIARAECPIVKHGALQAVYRYFHDLYSTGEPFHGILTVQ